MKVLLFLVVVLGTHAALAQPSDYREVAIRASVSVDSLWCTPAGGGYDRPFEFRPAYKVQCAAEVVSLKPDFAQQRLIFWSVGGDCHMKTAVKVFRSDEERRVRVIVNKLYGGCRAGGWRAGALTIEKPPSGYRVSVEAVGVDEGRQPGFAFPPPPPIVVHGNVPHRRINLTECLPLSGQSQGMISSDEHLNRNLEGTPDQKVCRERLAAEKVDLSTSTLIGVSFHSGYCGEPKGLKLSVVEETSSDHRNKIVVKAAFDDPKESCHIWTTYPVWLVVPKVAAGFLLEVDAKPTSRAHEPRVRQEKPIEWIES